MSRTVTYYLKVDASGAVVGVGEAEKGFKRLDEQTDKTSHSLLNLNKVAGLAAAAGLGRVFQQAIRRSIERGREFESQLASLEAITGITGSQLKTLGANSLELSKKYGTSASNIIEANKLVASQLAERIDFGTAEGFDMLQKVSEQTVVLAQAAGIQLSDAVATTTSIINQFNLSAEEGTRVINTLAAGSKFGAAEIPAIGDALVNAGSAAAGANVSIEETNALIQVLAANGQVGERAGTALRAIFLRLQTSGEQLAKYGLNEVNLQANGMAETLRQLAPIVNDATAMQQIFGQEAFNAASILIRNAESVESMTEKVTGTNTAYEQAAIRMDTFDGANQRLQATIDSKLIPAFMESNGLLVKLINNVATLIEEFAGGISIINSWIDAHSRLRQEIGMADASAENHIQTMSRLHEELAQAAIDGSLTADQYRELAYAYDLATENLRQHAISLYDDTDALKAQRDQLERQIESLQNATHIYSGWGASHHQLNINKLRKELESLNIEIAANEERIQAYIQAIEQGTISFDEFIARMREANAASAGGNDDGSQEVIESLLSIAQLQKAIHDEKQAFTSAESHELRLQHHERIMQLEAELEAIQALYGQEEVGLGSISGLKKALSDTQKQFNDAETQQERQRHFERMQHLQAELDFIEASFNDQTNNLLSVSDYQRAIAEERKAYNEAETATDREIHAQRIQQLEYELESIVTGIDVEELMRLDAHEAEMQRHRERMDMLEQYYNVASQMASAFASLSSNLADREIQSIERKKKAEISRLNTLLELEELTQPQIQALIKEREEAEEKYDRKTAEIKRRRANSERRWNISQVIMNTAIAIMKAAPNIPLQIATGILGAAQLAVVASQPVPQFAQGGSVKTFDKTQRIKGPGTGTSDSIPALLPPGAFILNAAATREAGNLIPALVSNGETYISPADASANRQILEAINASPSLAKGFLQPLPEQRFATGGSVGSAPQAMRIINSGGNRDETRQFMEAVIERLETLEIPVRGQIEDRGIGLSNDRFRKKINRAALSF